MTLAIAAPGRYADRDLAISRHARLPENGSVAGLGGPALEERCVLLLEKDAA
jgi:hypothetical protein